MHTQNTLHLSDIQFSMALQIIEDSSNLEPDIVVNILIENGIRQYPAQKLVQQFHFHKQLKVA